MRKIIAIVFVMFLWMGGCDDGNNGGSLKVVEFEGHEYVVLRVFRAGGICHKANCKFCEKQ